ncbi:UvrB/UvrC motif-containing protein [Planctomycetota bacterium]
MKCDSCDNNVATVHLTEIVNNKKKELHLCEECARSKGVSVKHSFTQASAPSAPLANPPAIAKPKIVLKADEFSGDSCPACGHTFGEFRKSGRLGCANDYAAFKRGLIPLLDKIHGHVTHAGKVPAHVHGRIARQKQIAQLREALNRAIQREEYEAAAELRDKIYKLEEQ